MIRCRNKCFSRSHFLKRAKNIYVPVLVAQRFRILYSVRYKSRSGAESGILDLIFRPDVCIYRGIDSIKCHRPRTSTVLRYIQYAPRASLLFQTQRQQHVKFCSLYNTKIFHVHPLLRACVWNGERTSVLRGILSVCEHRAASLRCSS